MLTRISFLDHPRLSRHGTASENGNLVFALAIVITIGILATVTVVSVIGGTPTATQSQFGSYAVAQARAGLSDALFRLDQMGDNPVDFCVGSPPVALLPSDLTSASCAPFGATPLATAPGLKYYVAQAVTSSLPAGVTNEFQVVVQSAWKGQQRTIDAVLYREANQFGFFGVSSFTSHGALKQANVEAVGASGQASQGNVDFGVGPNATAACSGNDANSHIQTVGQHGANLGACPQPLQENTNLEPSNPSVCAPGQTPLAFAPCVNTSNFANVSGTDYCPLPGIGIPNSLATVSALTFPPPAATAGGASPVFNCATSGATVTITTDDALPFKLTAIPPGTYYLDSNNVSIGEIDPSYLAGPVNLFILPAACNSTTCPAPTQNASCPTTSPPSLSLTANNNVASGGTPPPGEPSNWNVFWEGSDLLPSNKIWFDGVLYAPDAALTSNGANGLSLYGSLVLNCWTINGSPNLTFAYPFHANEYLVGWTVASYRITP